LSNSIKDIIPKYGVRCGGLA